MLRTKANRSESLSLISFLVTRVRTDMYHSIRPSEMLKYKKSFWTMLYAQKEIRRRHRMIFFGNESVLFSEKGRKARVKCPKTFHFSLQTQASRYQDCVLCLVVIGKNDISGIFLNQAGFARISCTPIVLVVRLIEGQKSKLFSSLLCHRDDTNWV